MTRLLLAALIGAGLIWAYTVINPSARTSVGLPQAGGGVLSGPPARGMAQGIGNLASRVLP
ncbi:hypothetical protein OEW28_06960 [Defluviimonas sp. WL0002]|uniref:Uncharacterized protein n=1 Tax=Albidovulum marisflavi TaxID=2984159 RepID=A0ABT2ZC73_9RHOB|nr:hypothetical protein [Defluviimonas sp. WL0002]MCV2868366.1 hypothetical protein [Defluviimonas sp. WL0002]